MKSCIKFLLLVLVFISLSINQTFAATLFDKGKNYVDAQMWDEAITTLNKVITSDPKNADAHYLLGYSYSKKGNTYLAIERYKSAIAISLISEKVNKAILKMNSNQIANSRQVFDEAIEKKPAIKKKVASQLFTFATTRLKENELSEANFIFNMAIMYDNDLTNKTCETYYKLGSASEKAAVIYFPIARNYCSGNSKRIQEMGERILSYASKFEGAPRKDLKEKALWFLPRQRVEEVIPTTEEDTPKLLTKPGVYNFKIKPFSKITGIKVKDGMTYSLTADETCYIKFENEKEAILLAKDAHGVRLPTETGGAFDIISIEKEVYFSVIVSE